MNDKKILKDERFLLNADEFETFNKKKLRGWKDYTDFEIVESDNEFTHINKQEDLGKIVLQEDEDEGEKYYAEEVYDEGEEVIFDDIHDSEVIVEKRLSYPEIIENLTGAFSSYGLTEENLALDLLSSMKFSRLINIKPTDDVSSGVEALFDAVGNPHFYIDYTEDKTIANDNSTIEFLDYAKANPFKVVFVYVKDMSSKNIFKFLRPFYPYIDNPHGDCFISTQGKSLFIPHNIYFLVSLKKDDVIFDTARRILRYLGTMNTPLTLGKPKDVLTTYEINTEVVTRASRDANDVYSVSESSWKKLDNVVELVHKVNNYTLENKISRRIEEFVVVYLSTGREEDDALDICLANNVFQELLVTTRPLMYLKECNIVKEISGQFGNNRMTLTKDVVSKYLALFDKGGNRKDA